MRGGLLALAEGEWLGTWVVEVANGVVISLAFGIAIRLQKGLMRGIGAALVSGGLYGLAAVAVHQPPDNVFETAWLSIVGGIAGGIIFVSPLSAAFALSFAVANRIADKWARAMAGAVAGVREGLANQLNQNMPSRTQMWRFVADQHDYYERLFLRYYSEK